MPRRRSPGEPGRPPAYSKPQRADEGLPEGADGPCGYALIQVEGVVRIYLPGDEKRAMAEGELLGGVLCAMPVVADFRRSGGSR